MFKQALIRSVLRLNEAKEKGLLINFALIGGFAVSRWAKPRATGDIDYIMQIEESSLGDLAAFLGGTFTVGDIQDPLLATVSYKEKVNEIDIPVQLLQFPKAWEECSLRAIDIQKIDGVSIPFVHWMPLILLKLYGGSAYDLEDAKAILQIVNPKKDEMDKLKTKAASLRVSRRLARVLKSSEIYS